MCIYQHLIILLISSIHIHQPDEIHISHLGEIHQGRLKPCLASSNRPPWSPAVCCFRWQSKLWFFQLMGIKPVYLRKVLAFGIHNVGEGIQGVGDQCVLIR